MPGKTAPYIATCECTPNNALIKYWGKRDEKLFLPTNSSFSVCMDEQLVTRTTVVFSPEFKQDEGWLDGKNLSADEMSSATKIFNLLRAKAKKNWFGRFASKNDFPTAAGFASSASGMAALAIAGAAALGLKLSLQELSIIARQGSGSACRSVLGGFVEWRKGEKADGSDSFAVQVASPGYWPELRCVIAIVAEEKKKVSSRSGMKQTIQTSSLFQQRLKQMPQKLEQAKQFVLSKNLPALLELVMRESNSMHACMLDTFPPVTYLNDSSRQVISAIHQLNEAKGAVIAGYTFDAGPNAHVYTVEKHVAEVKKLLEGLDGVKKTIVSKVGAGPNLSSTHLLSEKGELL